MHTAPYLKTGIVSQIALKRGPDGESFSDKERMNEERTADLFTRMFVEVRERFVRLQRGQTMTEYALILAAIAIAVFGIYRTLGNSIGSLASGVDSTLTNA